MRRRRRGDAGVGGVMVLGLAVVVLALGALLATLAAVAVARHRAAGVADLAALAAADSVASGAACAAAQRTAAAGSAMLLSCTVEGVEVQVVVEVRPPGPLGDLGAARGRARAGPAGAVPVSSRVPVGRVALASTKATGSGRDAAYTVAQSRADQGGVGCALKRVDSATNRRACDGVTW